MNWGHQKGCAPGRMSFSEVATNVRDCRCCLQNEVEAAEKPLPALLEPIAQEEQDTAPASAILWLKGIPMRGKTEREVSRARQCRGSTKAGNGHPDQHSPLYNLHAELQVARMYGKLEAAILSPCTFSGLFLVRTSAP